MNYQEIPICPKCHKPTTKFTKGVCRNCYRKNHTPKDLIICKRCHRKMPHQAKGLCKGCYNYVYHLDKVKAHNRKKTHGINSKSYEVITSKCLLCDIEILIELHHIDGNHKNKEITNLVGLCPLHHQMAETVPYKFLVQEELIKLGYKVIKSPKDIFDYNFLLEKYNNNFEDVPFFKYFKGTTYHAKTTL